MVKCIQVFGCQLQLKHFPVLLLFFLQILRSLKNEMGEEQNIVHSDISVNYSLVIQSPSNHSSLCFILLGEKQNVEVSDCSVHDTVGRHQHKIQS